MESFSGQNLVKQQQRPPVVVIMGHVDHGKTTLLDFIRKTKVAESETGGITQHTGAYQVEHQGRKITFIDTPGHEAFYAMRSRGAKVADIAVLVIAADEGIMPQTKEAITHIKHAGIPIVVAITKIDKPNLDIMRVKNQLLEEQIVVEDFGGKVPSVSVSSKTGEGIDSLLEIINLSAELEELKSNMEGKAKGVVIEAELNHKRGPIATLLVKEGILRKNDIISLSSTFGRVRELEDFLGNGMPLATPGTPAVVVGISEVPLVGEKFSVVDSATEAEKILAEKKKKYENEREVVELPQGSKILNIVLRADAGGTLEAVHEVLRGIKNDNIFIRVLSEGSGEIMESDIKLAAAANAVIIGFRTKLNQSAALFAKQMKVEIMICDIIYDIVSKVRGKINDILSTETEDLDIGALKVLAIFRTEKSRMIVGGKVTEGEITKGAKIRVTRNDEPVGEGRVSQLKIKDKPFDKVEKGQECGVLFEGPVRILVGDVLRAHEIRKKIIS